MNYTKSSDGTMVRQNGRTTVAGLPVIEVKNPETGEWTAHVFDPTKGRMLKYDPEKEKHAAEKERLLNDLNSISYSYKNVKGQVVRTMTNRAVARISGDRAIGVFEFTRPDDETVYKAIATYNVYQGKWILCRNKGVSNLTDSDYDTLIDIQKSIGWID